MFTFEKLRAEYRTAEARHASVSFSSLALNVFVNIYWSFILHYFQSASLLHMLLDVLGIMLRMRGSWDPSLCLSSGMVVQIGICVSVLELTVMNVLLLKSLGQLSVFNFFRN